MCKKIGRKRLYFLDDFSFRHYRAWGEVYGGGGIISPQRKKTYKAALQMMMQSGLVLQFLE